MAPRLTTQWGGHARADLQKRWGRESVYTYGRVDSTNSVARKLAEADAPAGAIVLSREQSEGRGRGGHTWASPAGRGVYLSMVFRPGALPSPALLPVLAGLGIVEALDRDFRGLRPALKWPNDIIAGELKVGGILAEAVWADGTPRHLVVGVGINVRPAELLPEELHGAGALDDLLGTEVPLVKVADTIVAGLETYLPEPPETLIAPLLERLDRYDWLRDKRITLTTETEPGASPPAPNSAESGERGGDTAPSADGDAAPPAHEPGPGSQEPKETVVHGMWVGIAPDGAMLFRPDRGALRRVSIGSVELAE
ncbi:MAG: biotin--[acetyl-CoA-carboxylase] ligase [Gemmatimonadota bacterium]